MPVLPAGATRWRIEQGYLHGDALLEGRVRRAVTPDGRHVFTHTIKRGMGLVREEQERTIDAEEFDRLWALTEGRRLCKDRWRAECGSVVWEIDEFHGLPPIEGRPLVLAEVEIPDGADPGAVEIPSWLRGVIVREVTDEPRFRNFALASGSVTI